MAARRYRTAGDYDNLPAIRSPAFQRMNPRARMALIAILLAAGIVAAALWYRGRHEQTANVPVRLRPHDADRLPPSISRESERRDVPPANRDNYLMVKPFFALSYNDTNGTPNWVRVGA